MSKVINFNARDFRFDSTCDSNVGSRMFITDCFGENVEVYEIGDWGWAWTQIFCEKQLEKNTDHVFRFAMTGGYNDTFDGTSQLIIVPIEGEESTQDDWENRYVYNLSQSQYKPALSKRWGNGILRVYEIPFNTYGCEKFRFMFIAQHAVARFFTAYELKAYAELEDYSYNDWHSERQQQIYDEDFTDTGSKFGDNIGRIVKDSLNGGFGKNIGKIVRDSLSNAFSGVGASDGANVNIDNRSFSEKEFAQTLKQFGDGCIISFRNIFVSSDESTKHYNIGGRSDGTIINAQNVHMTAKAFSMIVSKLGDGCILEMPNAVITAEGIDNMYDAGSNSDGLIVNISNANIPLAALNLLTSKLGDGCKLDRSNISVQDIYPAEKKEEVPTIVIEEKPAEDR